jgi:hypothetical protein
LDGRRPLMPYAFIDQYDHARWLMGTGGLDLRTNVKVLLVASDLFLPEATTLAEALAGSTECVANGAARLALANIIVEKTRGRSRFKSDAASWVAVGGALGGESKPIRAILYKDPTGASPDSECIPIANMIINHSHLGNTAISSVAGDVLTLRPHAVHGWFYW